MQCSSYVPIYYHARSVNVGGSGCSWQPFDNNANCGEERGYKTAMPPNNMNEYAGSDKEALKQIMQNQEATFRNQVQELHRLYRRQRELMDEMRMRENSHDRTTVQPDSFIRSNNYNEVEFLLSSSKESEKRTMDLEPPAPMCHVDHGKQVKEGNCSESSMELPNFQLASGSDFGSVKTGDMSSFDLKSRKTNCFIDLNEPIDLESLSSSSSCHFETCHMEIKCSNPCVPVEAIPESEVPNRARLMNYDDSSDGVNSSVAIDLNSVPVSCISETETNVENVGSTNKDAAVLDVCDDAMKNEKCVVKTEIEIDLNTGMGEENPPPLSSSVLQIKPAEDTELEGPVSPDNEECSPPRGKSEDIQVETPVEPEIIAAQTLVMILSSGDKEFKNPASLCWFADIVSSTGDDLENQIMKLGNDDQGENALNSPHVKKEKESGRSGTEGRTRGIKQRKDSEDVQTIEGSVETGTLRRKAGRKACGRPRKYSKQSPSDVAKKSISSILKQPATRSKQGILHSWGRTNKRQGDRRRRLRFSEFFLSVTELI
ncbi:hypothetical protein ACS0TY_006809 [Phlomoides rotata]